MTKCEVIDLTLSDCGSAISVHTASVPATTEIILQDSCCSSNVL